MEINKTTIRKEVLKKRDYLSKSERDYKSFICADRIIGHQWFYKAESIFCFISFGSEIDTRLIIEEAWKQGKKVYVPKIINHKMDFYEIHSYQELEQGYRGIFEPIYTENPFLYKEQELLTTPFLFLMPGVAFDQANHRLGYGGGYYDRYLADKPILATYSIAIGFACQFVTELLPQEATDIKPYQIILV